MSEARWRPSGGLVRRSLLAGASASVLLASTPSLLSCGYRSARAVAAELGRLSVTPGRARLSDGSLLEAACLGARRALDQASLLSSERFPTLVVELVRIDESSAGISAATSLPLARGTQLSLVGRAWIEETAGAEARQETGELQLSTSIAVERDPRLESFRRDDALKFLAERLGGVLVQRILGYPTPRDEGMWYLLAP